MKAIKRFKSFIALVFFLLPVFSAHASASSVDYTDITEVFQYKLGDCTINSKGIPEWIMSKDDLWSDFKQGDPITSQMSNNDGTIWFKVQLPKIMHNRSGIYFDDLQANSLDVYIHKEKVYSYHRKWFYYHNSFVLPLGKSDSNQYLYIKSSYLDNKFGPGESVLVGNYKELEHMLIRKDIINMYIGIGLLFISAIVLICTMYLKGYNKKIGFSLFFLLLFIGYVLIVSSTNFIMYFPDYEPILLAIYDVALLCGFPLLTYFFMLSIRPDKKTLIHRICYTQSIFTLLCLIILVFNMASDYQYNGLYVFLTTTCVAILFIIQLIVLVGTGIHYTIKGNKNAKLFIIGFSLFSVGLISELLVFVVMDKYYNFLFWEMGLIAFLISLIIIFIKEYIYSHNMMHTYFHELKRMNTVARTDYLTNILNRMGLTDEIGIAIDKHRTSNQNFYLAICDIDDFKLLNDTYGHNFGDDVLKDISKIIVGELGTKHQVGRWGGEEFLLLLLSDYHDAYKIIEQIRKKIYNHTFVHKNTCLHVSVTFGMCKYDDALGFTKCLELADQALYSGKESGKNIIKVHKYC